MSWLLVALGGAVGASCRYLVDLAVTRRFGSYLPWGTLLVNLLGSAAFGLLVGLISTDTSAALLALVGTGFCGAFTTASALAWEILALAEGRKSLRAVANLGLSVVVGVTLAGAGIALGLSLSA